MNNCLIKIVRSCSLCGVLSLKCDSCLIKTVQHCSPCGVRVVIEKGVFSTDFYEILQELFASHAATTMKFSSENIV